LNQSVIAGLAIKEGGLEMSEDKETPSEDKEDVFDKMGNLVWGFVGLVISTVIAIWVLNFFLPLKEWFPWLDGIL
jgi:hypothetical protein